MTLRASILILLAFIGTAASATAQTVQTFAAALRQDAGEYARAYGVPLAEAERRLRAQQDSVPATDAIARRFASRLAGISVQHRPDYRIIIYLTGTAAVASTTIPLPGGHVPVTFRTGVRASRERVLWALTNHQATIRTITGTQPSMGVDPRSGELVVIVGTAAARAAGGSDALDARIEALTGVPARVQVFDRIDRNLGATGGGRLEGKDAANGKRYRCTSGFVVSDGARSGLTTAAHCLDTLSYIDVERRASALDFVGQWGWGYHDVQVHTAHAPLAPIFLANTDRTLARPVQSQRSKSSTRAGDFVCHRGESTGYSCAEVQLLDFAPAGELCGGYCLPTWVAVAGPTCKGGDSGGPVFSGTTAFGIVKGATFRADGSCAFYFYMSLDYLPTPWALAIEPARS